VCSFCDIFVFQKQRIADQRNQFCVQASPQYFTAWSGSAYQGADKDIGIHDYDVGHVKDDSIYGVSLRSISITGALPVISAVPCLKSPMKRSVALSTSKLSVTMRIFHWVKEKTQSEYQLWQEGSHPQLLATESVLRQKLEYIHQNTVTRGYVDLPVHSGAMSVRSQVTLGNE